MRRRWDELPEGTAASLSLGAVREFYGRHSPEQNLSQKWDKFSSAEEVGLEPTSGFLHRDGLAIHWNNRYPTPPISFILTLRIDFSQILLYA